MENKLISVFMVTICVLFAVFRISTQLCTGFSSMATSSMRTGEKLSDQSFLQTHNVTSVHECATLCLYLSRCASFNFNTVNGTCEMNQNDTVTGTVVADGDYVLSDISNWPTNIALGCSGRLCDENSTCVPMASSYNCYKISQ